MKLSQEAQDLLYQEVDRHVIRRNVAKAAMQGLLSNSNLNAGRGYSGCQITAMAVEAADSLLAALEE